MLIFYIGMCFFLFFGTYCKIRQKVNLGFVVPNFLEENDQERLSSNNIAETDQSKKKKEFTKISLENNASQNQIVLNILLGIFCTDLAFNTHAFLYVFLMMAQVPQDYNIILMVYVAIPISLCLICFSLISANIFYNLWVDVDFTTEYLRKCQFKKILLNVFVRMGLIFIFVACLSTLFSSFCGMVGTDAQSTIVFIVLISLVSGFFIVKFLTKYCSQLYKFINSKNNI